MKTPRYPFADLVRERLTDLGKSVHAFEDENGIPKGSVRNLLLPTRGTDPSVSRAKQIAEALGLEFYIGPPRQVGTEPADDSFVEIDRYETRLSAGPGAAEINEDPIGTLAFKVDWLRKKGLVAKRCMIMTATGDSMYPTLEDGDLVMIDGDQTDVKGGEVYALVDIDGDTRVKRVEIMDGYLFLRSDKLSVGIDKRTPEEVARMKIIGRVVWSGRDWT